MSLVFAEVSPEYIGTFHPDRAAGVEHSVAFQRLASAVNRDIFGQPDAAALKAAHFGLEHGANTDLMRSAADAAAKLTPETDALAGVVVDTFDEAVNAAHYALDKGMNRGMEFAEAFPATLAATIAAAGAVLAGQFKGESTDVALAGDNGYDEAMDVNGDGLVTPDEVQMNGLPEGLDVALELHNRGVVIAEIEKTGVPLEVDMTYVEANGTRALDGVNPDFLAAKAAAQEAAFARV